MDLYAYTQIDKYKKYLEENNIDIPRLRGLRLMKNEEPVSEEKIKEYAKELSIGIIVAGIDSVSEEKIKEYAKELSICIIVAGIDSVSEDKRKRYELALKRVKKQYDMFNKYAGKEILYVHARLGGSNWACCGGSELEKHPLYLERVDDYFDSTYCDIYFKLKEK